MRHEPRELHDLFRPLCRRQLSEVTTQRGPLRFPVRAPVPDSLALFHAEDRTSPSGNPNRLDKGSKSLSSQKVREALDPDTGNFSNWETGPA
jgi:hypothetical protein